MEEELNEIDMSRMGEEATGEEILDWLNKYATAELTSRPVIMADWPEPATIHIRDDKNTQLRAGSNPVVNYRDDAVSMTLAGRWLENTDPARARITLDLTHSAVGESRVSVDDKTTLPIFTERTFQERVTAEAGKRYWIRGPALPKPGDLDKVSRLVIGLKAAPMTAAMASESSAGPRFGGKVVPVTRRCGPSHRLRSGLHRTSARFRRLGGYDLVDMSDR